MVVRHAAMRTIAHGAGFKLTKQRSISSAVTTASPPPRPSPYPNSLHIPFEKNQPTTVKSRFLANPQDVGLVNASFSGGQCKAGVENGPEALIKAGLIDDLCEKLNYNIRTMRDFKPSQRYQEASVSSGQAYSSMRNPLAVSVATQEIASQAYRHASHGRFVLTLGGDHSVAIGSVAGVAKAARERLGRDIAIIWVDAHADINRPAESKSGNIHGMPLSFLTGLCRDDTEEYFGWMRDDMLVNSSKVVYIGLRDVDVAEKRAIRENDIKAYTMLDIDRFGIAGVMQLALAYIGPDTPIHLSFDIDSLDPNWAPATGTPVPGGLSPREAHYVCSSIYETGNLISADLVEVNPELCTDCARDVLSTVNLACSLVKCALGETLL